MKKKLLEGCLLLILAAGVTYCYYTHSLLGLPAAGLALCVANMLFDKEEPN